MGGSSPPGLRYAKTSTFATSHGPMYEVKLAALMFLRFKNTGRAFQIASNVDGAGALDDILVKYRPVEDPHEWHTYFLQLKHKQSAMVRISSLSGGGGNFSLKKYLKSYIEIKNTMFETGEIMPVMFNGSFDKCTFVLYTNAQADDELSVRTRDVVLNQVENMLKTDSGNGLVIKFSPESDPVIYGSIQELEDTFLEAEGFLDKLKIFTGQATETQLDSLIKRELVVRFKGCLCVDVLYRYYEELIKDWCYNSNLVLDQNCDFPERAFVETMSVKQQESFHLNVNFSDDFWEAYSFDLTEDVTLLQIDTCGLLVTCAKVLQYLFRMNTQFLFFGIESLLCEQNVVIPVWNNGCTDLLVIACNNYDAKRVQQLLESICNVLEDNPNKKLVLLTVCGSSGDLQLRSRIGHKFQMIKNDFRFSHLDDETKERILDRDLLFQGHSIALRCLFDQILKLTETVCNAQLVETLLSNKMLTIGPKLDDTINFFIPRTLKWCNVIKKEILKAEELSDVFSVSGITIQELQDLAPVGERIVHSNNAECANSRFVVLDSVDTVDDFLLLCEKSSYTDIHWLHLEKDGHLRWIQSHGNIDLITQCLDENFSTAFHPDTALDVSHRVVLVVAEPGMGKTTLVSYLARETKRVFPHLWVIEIHLKDHTKLLEEQGDVIEFLVAAVGLDEKSALERSFFRFSLEQEGNVVVLLDGFDEIAPSYADQGCTLLDNLLKTRVHSVWVTSRQSMNNVLERNLSCLAFDMEKFTENDQKTFFKKSWANTVTPMTDAELDAFLTELLQLLSRSLNDKEKHFTGIPLQTMMLAEVFEDYVKNPKINPLPERLNLLHLFEQVIEKKFNVYAKKKSIAIDKNSLYEISELRKRLVKNHMNAALVLLVSEKEIQTLHSKEKIIKKTVKFLQNIIGSHDKTGIVDSVVNGKPHFVHRTFAEFFAAKWFSKYFDKNVSFLQKHLFGIHFRVVRDIFDRLLVRDARLHAAILNNDTVCVESLLTEGTDVNAVDAGGRTALHLAASLGFALKKVSENDRFIGPRPKHMTELLIEYGANINDKDGVLKWTPLQYALETKTCDAVETLLQNNADRTILSVNNCNMWDQQLWGTIIENGFVNFMTLLLDNGLPVESTFDDKHQFLHKAVIHGREHLVRLLISRGNVVKSCGYWEELLILASGYGHSHVVRILVGRLEGDRDSTARYVNARDTKGRTALSEASRFGHAEVVRYLALEGGDVWARDGRGESPLHRAAGQGNLAAVEALLASVDDGRVPNYIDERDKYGWTSIHRAAEDKHTAVLTVLIAKGGDIWARDFEGKMPLHIASERGHLEVVQQLVKTLGGDKKAIVRYITSEDEEGRTPKEWTTDEERFKWSFEDECLAVAKWLDEVLKENSLPSVQTSEYALHGARQDEFQGIIQSSLKNAFEN